MASRPIVLRDVERLALERRQRSPLSSSISSGSSTAGMITRPRSYGPKKLSGGLLSRRETSYTENDLSR